MTEVMPRLTRECDGYEFLTEDLPAVLREEPRRLWMNYWFESGHNVESLIADHFEEHEDYCEQADINVEAEIDARKPPCGSIGCIGGWTEEILGPYTPAYLRLGLTRDQAHDLFYPDELLKDPEQGTAAHVERVIAHMAAFAKEHEQQLRSVRFTPGGVVVREEE